MDKKYIEDAWQSYRKMVVPQQASEVQVTESRRAFYAGAAVLFQIMMISMSEGSEDTENELQIMRDINDELVEFGQEIDADVLGTQRH